MGKGKKGGEDMQEERPEEKEEKPRQDDDNAPETKHADEGVEHRGGEDRAEGGANAWEGKRCCRAKTEV